MDNFYECFCLLLSLRCFNLYYRFFPPPAYLVFPFRQLHGLLLIETCDHMCGLNHCSGILLFFSFLDPLYIMVLLIPFLYLRNSFLKVLLPLVNVPMINYTLAWLESAGVEEVIVFCCAHSKQVINYLESSEWFSHPNFSVTTIESHNSISAGDALRLIYERNVVCPLNFQPLKSSLLHFYQ